jgi:hypothetical protein
MTTMFDTKAEARISEDAQIVRYCCRPRFAMTSGTRMPVMMIRAMEVLNKAANCSLRFQFCPDRRTMGMGNAISKMSVIMSVDTADQDRARPASSG